MTTTEVRQVRQSARSFPLFGRFPALARLPRVELGSFPSPVSHVTDVPSGGEIWIKRDDLDAPEFGGNKVRALEFLLGSVRPGDTLLTIGGEGSTHVLATAAMGGRLGASTNAIRWRHEMNPEALHCSARAAGLCAQLRTTPGPVSALLLSLLARRRGSVRWIPPGGTNALGMLGHVNAGLELAEQVARGELPAPARVVVPLGTGGTAAGLALGFAVAGLPTQVVAARVVPRLVANRRRLLQHTRSCAELIEQLDGSPVPRVHPSRVQVLNDVYGGAYGRPLAAARDAAATLHRASGIVLDNSYSAKAFAAALDLAQRERVLFWLTYDGRVEGESRKQTAESSELPRGREL
jgi:D-cysteine desulfhydrase